MTAPPDRSVDDRRELLGTVDAGDELSAATAAGIRVRVGALLDGRRDVGQAVAGNPFVESTELETAEIRLVLDRVTRFDQSGLGLLVGLHREARSAGVRLVLVTPAALLFAAMRRLGLHRILTVELDVRPSDLRDPITDDEAARSRRGVGGAY